MLDEEGWLIGVNFHDGAVVASYPWDHYTVIYDDDDDDNDDDEWEDSDDKDRMATIALFFSEIELLVGTMGYTSFFLQLG